jgi:hypothetical protein
VVEAKWVNWEWMKNKRNRYFDDIKVACDTLELTNMMCFKYDWNNEIIFLFYSTLFFDIDGQRMIWMTDKQKYEVITREFAILLGLEHHLEMPTKIHDERILDEDQMLFMYAVGDEAHPPKTQNFLHELNTLHHLFRVTMAPRIGDATACPQYEQNLI